MKEEKVLNRKMQLVPKLRFKKFTESWKKGTIGDYYQNLRTGMTPSRTRPDYFKGEIPWITSGELNYGYIENTVESITKEAVENTNLEIYSPNTLFIAITGLEAPGTRGKCAMNKVPATTNQSCMAFEEIPNVSTLFLFQWYKRNAIQLYYNFAQGTKQQSFNNKLVKDFIFNIPTLLEQQKIASFLSVIDEKIQQFNRKKELLEQYKKGVMQQLFSGKLRFKDESGKMYPKWEEKRLEEVCDCMDNLRKPLNDAQRQNMQGSIPYWGANNIMDYVNDYLFDETIVLLAEDGGNFNEYKSRPIANLSRGKCWVNNHTHVLKGKKNLSNEFLFYSLVHKNITGFVSGGTRAKLTKSQMLKIPIGFPSIKEQQEIANFLSSIDTKIENVSAQINQTQLFKKGLLQQMFV